MTDKPKGLTARWSDDYRTGDSRLVYNKQEVDEAFAEKEQELANKEKERLIILGEWITAVFDRDKWRYDARDKDTKINELEHKLKLAEFISNDLRYQE